MAGISDFFRCGLQMHRAGIAPSQATRYFDRMYTLQGLPLLWRVAAGLLATMGFAGTIGTFGTGIVLAIRDQPANKAVLGMLAGIALVGFVGSLAVAGAFWHRRFGTLLRAGQKRREIIGIFGSAKNALAWRDRQNDLYAVSAMVFPQQSWAMVSLLPPLAAWMFPLSLTVVFSIPATGHHHLLYRVLLATFSGLGFFLSAFLFFGLLGRVMPWGGSGARNTRFQRAVLAQEIEDLFS